MFASWWRRLVQRKPRSSRRDRPAQRAPHRPRSLWLEPLEDRTLLSTLTVDASGNLVFTSGPTAQDTLGFSTPRDGAGKYTFTDALEAINVTAPPGTFSGDGTNSVTVTGITTILVNVAGSGDTVNAQSIDTPTTSTTVSNTVAGTDLVNVGDGTLGVQGIQQPLAISNTNGSTALVVDDSPNTGQTASTISDTTISGLAPADITYGSLSALTVHGGNGGSVNGNDAFTVLNTGAGYTTTLSTQGVFNAVNVNATTGDLNIIANGPSGDPSGIVVERVFLGGTDPNGIGFTTLNDIKGHVGVAGGSGFVELILHDDQQKAPTTVTFSNDAATGTIVSTPAEGTPVQVSYTTPSLASIDFFGGEGGNTFTVNNTIPATPALNSGTFLETGKGGDTVNVLGTTAPLDMNSNPVTALIITGSKAADTLATTVVVGNTLANRANPGNLSGINGGIQISNLATNPHSRTHLILDDRANTSSRSLTVQDDQILGLGTKGDQNILFFDQADPAVKDANRSLASLTIDGGIGDGKPNGAGTQFVINLTEPAGTPVPGFPTTLNSNSINDSVFVEGTVGPLSVNVNGSHLLPDGSDLVLVNIGNGGTGTNLDSIQGAVQVFGTAGTVDLEFDDSTATVGRTVTFSDNGVTGSIVVASTGLPTVQISYSTPSIAEIVFRAGNQGNTFTVNNTFPATTASFSGTFIDTGTGGDVVNVLGATAPLDSNGNPVAALIINGSTATDTVVVGNTLAGLPNPGNLSGINGSRIRGSIQISNTSTSANSRTTLILDDRANTSARTLFVQDDQVFGLGPKADQFISFFDFASTTNLNDANRSLASLTIDGGIGDGKPGGAGTQFIINLTEPAGTSGFRTTLNSNSINDTVFVEGTVGPVDLRANGSHLLPDGSDSELVRIGDAGTGTTLGAIRGAVNLAGTPGLVNLVLDDSPATAGRMVTLDNNATTGMGMVTVGSLVPVTYATSSLFALVFDAGNGGNTFTVNNTIPGVPFASSGTFLNTGTGGDTVNVQRTSVMGNGLASLIINGSTAADTVVVGNTLAGLATTPGSLANINGGIQISNISTSLNSRTTLILDDRSNTSARTLTVQNNQIRGLGPMADQEISFFDAAPGSTRNDANQSLASLTIDGGIGDGKPGGAGTQFIINLTEPAGSNVTGFPTTLNSNSANDVVSVNATTGPLTLHANGTVVPDRFERVTLGSLGQAGFTTLDAIRGPVSITGTAGLVGLFLEDPLNTTARAVTLSTGAGTGTVTGAAPAVISYTTATLSFLNFIAGPQSGTTLTVDDAADAVPTSVVLSATAVTGLAPSPIFYSGLSGLTVNGGHGGTAAAPDVFDVLNTAAATATTLNTATPFSNVFIEGTTGPLALHANGTVVPGGFEPVTLGSLGQAGFTTLDAIRGPVSITGTAGLVGLFLEDPLNTTARAVTLSTGAGTGTGSVTGAAPAVISYTPATLSFLNFIAGPPSGTTLTVDDAADAAPTSVGVSATAVTGLAPASIFYSGLGGLTVLGGSGGTVAAPDVFDVVNTAAGTATTLVTANPFNSVFIEGTTGPLSVNATGSPGGGPNPAVVQVRIGNAGRAGSQTTLDNVRGGVSLSGSPGIIGLFLDDSTNSVGKNVTLGNDNATGSVRTLSTAGGAPVVVTYTVGSLRFLVFHAGTAANTFTVTNTAAATFLLTGPAGDTVNVLGTSTKAPLVLSGSGTSLAPDTLVVGNTQAALLQSQGTLTGVHGTIQVTNANGAATNLILDDRADSSPLAYAVGNNSILLSTASGQGGILFATQSGLPIDVNQTLRSLTVYGGSGGGASITINLTTPLVNGAQGFPITINSAAGGDAVFVAATTSPVTVNATAAAGAKLVQVVVGAADASGKSTLDGVNALVTVTGTAGLVDLFVQDSSNTSPTRVTLGTDPDRAGRDAVTRVRTDNQTAVTVTFEPTTLDSLNFFGGSGGNTFAVNDTLPGRTSTTLLNTGAKGDTVNVASTTGTLIIVGSTTTDTVNIGDNRHSLADIHNTIQISNQAQNPQSRTRLTIDDRTDPSGHLVTIRNAGIFVRGTAAAIIFNALDPVTKAAGANDAGAALFPGSADPLKNDHGLVFWASPDATIDLVQDFSQPDSLQVNGDGSDTINAFIVSTSGKFLSLDVNGGNTFNVEDTSGGAVFRNDRADGRVFVDYVNSANPDVALTLQVATYRGLRNTVNFFSGDGTSVSDPINTVQALYHEILGRSATLAEIQQFWMPLYLDPSRGEPAVVRGIERSGEAFTHTVRNWYQRYLGRPAMGGEEQGWVVLMTQGHSEEEVLSGILSSGEYFTHMAGSNNRALVQSLYGTLLGRSASEAEVSLWVNSALPVVGRWGVAWLILNSAEYRAAAINAVYQTRLGRDIDDSGRVYWTSAVFRPSDLLSVGMGIEDSIEFMARLSLRGTAATLTPPGLGGNEAGKGTTALNAPVQNGTLVSTGVQTATPPPTTVTTQLPPRATTPPSTPSNPSAPGNPPSTIGNLPMPSGNPPPSGGEPTRTPPDEPERGPEEQE